MSLRSIFGSPMGSSVGSLTCPPYLSRRMYSLGSKTNTKLGKIITSRKAYQRNIGTDAVISISSGTGEYRINGGVWTSDPGIVSAGDKLQARLISSADFDIAASLVFNIGTGSDTFTVITVSDPMEVTFQGQPVTFDGDAVVW